MNLRDSSGFPWEQIPRTVFELCDRLQSDSLATRDSAGFLKGCLSEIAAEFAASWVGCVSRTLDWQINDEFGRHELDELPYSFLEEALDRESAGWTVVPATSGWSLIAVPLTAFTSSQSLLVLLGRNLKRTELSGAVAVSHTFDYCRQSLERMEQSHARTELIARTLELVAGFAEATEMQPLLERIADGAVQLLGCERASIFVWDREREQVIACPALGVEGGTLRLPDHAGIVGQVIHSGEAIQVENAYEDPRFDNSVDQQTGFHTRSILCVPMCDQSGQLLGAFQTLNKRDGAFTEDDGACLSQLGVHASVALKSAREREVLLRSHQQLTERVTEGVQLVGESAAIVALRHTMGRLAETDLPVLVLGESGTGKEVVAQSLHYCGPRSEYPFVAVNCAALAESLLESELFGHEQGAFTDARETRPGKFEVAEGGTIFLD